MCLHLKLNENISERSKFGFENSLKGTKNLHKENCLFYKVFAMNFAVIIYIFCLVKNVHPHPQNI